MESFNGTSVVAWQGKIERQLVNLLNDSEKGKNFSYADKLREFLKIWRANEITGSINRETLEILKSAADILSVDQWDMSAYFSSLKDQLKVLIASEEQLPRGMYTEPGNDPYAGGGHGGGAPPMSPSFGAEEKPPGGEAGAGGGGEAGAGGGPGAPADLNTLAGEEAGGPPPETAGEPGGAGSPGEEAPGAEPGAPEPGGEENENPEPEDMPGGRLGSA
jgi:hypothetical protein